MPGQSGSWVPAQVIEWIGDGNGRALEDYTARELDVNEGDVLNGLREVNEWRWCFKSSDRLSGWVPMVNLREVRE